MNHTTAIQEGKIPHPVVDKISTGQVSAGQISIARKSIRPINTRPFNINDNCNKKIKYIESRKARSEFDAIKPFSTVRNLQKNDMLFNEGDDAVHFYEIIFGYVKTYTILSDGRRFITNFLGKGDFIGIPQEKKHSFSAQALTRTDVRRYSFTQMNEMMRKSPAFSQKVMEIMKKELTHAKNQMVLLGCKTPEEKVASFLLNCDRRRVNNPDQEALLYLPMSLIDIADHLGLAQETVCRVLGKYKRSGLLEFKSLRRQRELYVRNIKSLMHQAELHEY